MNWSDFMLQNVAYKKFDITDTSRNSNQLKIYPENELATEDVAMHRHFETAIGGNINMYVRIVTQLSSISTLKLSHTISVRDKDNNIVAETVLNTTGEDSKYTTIVIPVTALNKYTISTICSNPTYQDKVKISDMILYGKIVDNTNWYIF